MNTNNNIAPRDDIARVVVGYGGGMIGECVNVPITPTSTCANIVKEILTKYPMYSNLKAEWGLFVPDLKVKIITAISLQPLIN